MEAALAWGARIINDVSALEGDGSLAIAARSGAPVILMHMRGEPGTMQKDPHYALASIDIADYLAARVAACEAVGIPRARIVVDPGIGFGKTGEHNLQLLARACELTTIGPLMIGASRKAFIGRLTGREAGPDRMAGSLAAVCAAARAGAAFVRVHDVRETADFLEVMDAIR
jgi:dihydropteroate synthase